MMIVPFILTVRLKNLLTVRDNVLFVLMMIVPFILTVSLRILLTVRDNVLFDSNLNAAPPSSNFSQSGKSLTAARHRSLFNYILNKFLSSIF